MRGRTAVTKLLTIKDITGNIACPHCQSDDFKLYRTESADEKGVRIRYHRCKKCGKTYRTAIQEHLYKVLYQRIRDKKKPRPDDWDNYF